jgi:hypothetical protein
LLINEAGNVRGFTTMTGAQDPFRHFDKKIFRLNRRRRTLAGKPGAKLAGPGRSGA